MSVSIIIYNYIISLINNLLAIPRLIIADVGDYFNNDVMVILELVWFVGNIV